MARFDVTFTLDDEDRILIAEEVANRIRGEILALVCQARGAPGIRVLSPAEVAKILGKSTRHLVRMEATGSAPRRRRISRRRVGYYAHEIDGTPHYEVIVRDERTLTIEDLVAKLGVNKKTIARMVEEKELPEPADNRWLEREIDDWLLKRPQV